MARPKKIQLDWRIVNQFLLDASFALNEYGRTLASQRAAFEAREQQMADNLAMLMKNHGAEIVEEAKKEVLSQKESANEPADFSALFGPERK